MKFRTVVRARAVLVAGFFLLSGPLLAQQAILQGGPWKPGHAPMYKGQGSSQPVVVDSGPAGGGGVGVGLSELGVTATGTGTAPYAGQGTGPLGTNVCDYDAPITNPTGYHFLCLSANANGGGVLAYGAGGTASPLPFSLNLNGTSYQFPFVLSGMVGPNPSIIGDVPVFANTQGTLTSDGGPAAYGVLTVSNLKAVPPAGRPAGYSVRTAGYYTAGDSPEAVYTLSLSPCPLNTGAGDGGSQISSNTAGYCWLLANRTAYDVRLWGASGSTTQTTGTVSANSGGLTLASAGDFQNGQYIDVYGAGPGFNLNQATGVSIATGGTTGSVTYCVRIASVDANLGVGPATTEVCNAGDGIAFPNPITPPNPKQTISYTVSSGTAPTAYLIYVGATGAETCKGVQAGNSPNVGSWTYYGQTSGCPSWAPNTPPSASSADVLRTQIVSGGGTTNLVVSPNASTGINGGTVKHDDTTPFQNALASVSTVGMPCATFHLTQGLTLNQASGQSLRGVGKGCSVLSADGAYDIITLPLTSGNATSFSQYLSDFGINASGMVSGFCVTINGANRPNITNIEPNSCYNDMQITDSFIGTVDKFWSINQRRGDYGWYFWGTGSGVATQAGVYDLTDINTSSAYQGVSLRINGNVASIRARHFGMEAAGIELVADNAIGAGQAPIYLYAYDMGFNACFLHCMSLTSTQNYVFYTPYIQQSGSSNESVYIDTTASQTKFIGGTITMPSGGNGITNHGFATEVIGTDITSGSASLAGIECMSDAVDMMVTAGTSHNTVSSVQSTTMNVGVQLDAGCKNPHVDGVWRGQVQDVANLAGSASEVVVNGVSYPVPNSHVSAAGDQPMTVVAFPNLYLGSQGNQAFFDTTGFASPRTYTYDTATNILNSRGGSFVGDSFTIIWRNHSNNAITVANNTGITLSGTTIPASGGAGFESQTRVVGTVTGIGGSAAITIKVCANLAGAC